VSEYVGTIVHGVKEANAALEAMQVKTDLGTKKALKAVQTQTKRSVKGKMRGRARWDRRGPSTKTGETVKLNLTPHRIRRSGGPGKFTGTLAKSIVSSRRPRKEGTGAFSGVVFSGSKDELNITNIYKWKLEAKYPYFAPGVRGVEAKWPDIWKKAWGTATKT
jgi:hypothetical protein